LLQAADAAHYLKAFDATNFVEMELQPRLDLGQRAIVFTVAYKDGERPAMQIARLKKELEQAVEKQQTLVEDNKRLNEMADRVKHNGGLILRRLAQMRRIVAEAVALIDGDHIADAGKLLKNLLAREDTPDEKEQP
jgi:hypothetical protein